MNSVFVLSGLGIFSLLAEIFNAKRFLFPVVVLGLVASALLLMADWNQGTAHYSNMLTFDNYAVAFSMTLSLIAALWFLMSKDYFADHAHTTDHFSLVLFAVIGAMFMVSYTNLAMLFLGIEVLSISLYVLAGSSFGDIFSNEASFKYFLMGSFATGFLLFGIALIYGVTASFDLHVIAAHISAGTGDKTTWLYAGILLLIVGLGFKISAVPFHFWAPDVYEGAPTVITAFMSTIVKIAAFAGFYRLFSICFATVSGEWTDVVQVLAILTLLVSNITAVYQHSVKRMLAYSSVSHAGYLLISLLALNTISASAILYYAVAYALATITAFTVLHNIEADDENAVIDSFNGLVKRNPYLAFCMAIAMLSLAGIPPLAGFFAKYYMFTVAFKSGYIALVVLAVVTSLIGIYYYFRIIIAMYLKSTEKTGAIRVPLRHSVIFAITLLLIVIFGVFPELLVGLV
ncbi:MAG TPA: NADH-quinone oxidoreductase subunit N [Chryseosolibacter sp.]